MSYSVHLVDVTAFKWLTEAADESAVQLPAGWTSLCRRPGRRRQQHRHAAVVPVDRVVATEAAVEFDTGLRSIVIADHLYAAKPASMQSPLVGHDADGQRLYAQLFEAMSSARHETSPDHASSIDDDPANTRHTQQLYVLIAYSNK